MVRVAPGLPLVVGLGGHRDLRDQDVPALEARLGEVLDGLRRRVPHTPVTLLSSLAEGADRLGARVALARGCRLVAPLPLPREDYEADFATAASRAEFAALLGRADGWLVVPGDPAGDREHHYARAAVWIVERSQLVVALWDGQAARGAAGTGALVRFALEGVPEGYGGPRGRLDVVERRPVVHVMAPRRGDPGPAPRAGDVRWLHPEGGADAAGTEGRADAAGPPAAVERLWRRIDELNRDAGRLAGAGAPTTGLLPPAAEARLPAALAGLDRAYRLADALSIRYQALTRRTLGGLLALAFVAALALQLGQLTPGPTPGVDAVYVAALAAAYAVWLWARRVRHQTRHLDYRALAEGLRVQFFWRLAGLSGSAADHYLRRQQGELDWIRRALRTVDLAAPPAPPGDGLELAATHWVTAQAGYFARAAGRNDTRDRRIRGVGYTFFAVALALGLGKYVVTADHPALVVVGLVPVVGALCQVWADRLALGPLARQYARMGLVFANAQAALGVCLGAGDAGGARSILHEVGVEALAENADWVILHRERPVQMPGAPS